MFRNYSVPRASIHAWLVTYVLISGIYYLLPVVFCLTHALSEELSYLKFHFESQKSK